MKDGAAAREWWGWARMGAAITADTQDGARFGGLGVGSYLAFPQGVLEGVGRVWIGADCVVNEHVTLSATLPGSTEPEGPKEQDRARIVLGDRCVLGRGTEILALDRVEMGEDVWTASRVTIVDHNHNIHTAQPDVPLAHRMPLRTGAIRIGRGSVISTGATILAGARIGEYCMVAAGAVVRAGHYRDHSLLAGVPARATPLRSQPVAAPEPVPLDIPAGLPGDHPDPDLRTLVTNYRQAHAAAARQPSPHSYRVVADQAVRLQAALAKSSQDHEHAALCNALFDRANEFARQALLFPIGEPAPARARTGTTS